MGKFLSQVSILCILAALLLLNVAVAKTAIVSEDWKKKGDNLITTDTDTGLQWLDATVTVGKSWDKLSQQLGPRKTFVGWMLASSKQFNTLIKNATGVTIEEGKNLGWTGTAGEKLSDLLKHLGITKDFGPFIQTCGLLSDAKKPFHATGIIVMYKYDRPAEVFIEQEGLQDFFGSRSSGAFLIRKK